MSLSDRDRRFAPQPAKSAGTGESAASRAACNPGAASDACETRPAELDLYVGTLAQAMWELDLERRALTRDALERSRLNSAFNALTWPAVAFAAAKRLRDPGWSPRDAVALGFAAHRVLGEGIPERDRVYLQTANRLACSLMVAEAWLYEKDPRSTGVGRGFELRHRAYTLEVALNSHETQRAALVPKLVVKSGSGGGLPPLHQVHADRLAAIGKGTGGGGTPDPTTPFLDAIGQSFTQAQATHRAARQTEDEVLDAGTRLRHQQSRIKNAMFAELQSRAPGPADPLAAARQMVEALDKAAARSVAASTSAATAAAKAQSRKAAADAWEPTPAQLKGFTTGAVDGVTTFWTAQEIPLRSARRSTQEWLDSHQRRVAAFRKEATSLGCGDGDLAAFVTNLAVRAALPAPAAASAGTPSSNESAIPAVGSSTP